jgi:hypothetical protein
MFTEFDEAKVVIPEVKTLKQKWIEALRSGMYCQVYHGTRHREDGFCALGVLIDIIDHEGWRDHKDTHLWYDHRLFDNQYMWQSDAVGLPISAAVEIARMNDGDKLSFNLIADWIEANVIMKQEYK